MNLLKKILGILWIITGPVLIWLLISGAIDNIDPSGKKDINNAVPWIIIISIFIPVSIGLMIFGYYSLKGEYGIQNQSSGSSTKTK